MDESELKKYLEKEFQYKQKQYRTFHIQYHPKLLCKALWAYEEKDGHKKLDQIIVMRLSTFKTKYYRRRNLEDPYSRNLPSNPSSRTVFISKKKIRECSQEARDLRDVRLEEISSFSK